MPPRAGHRRRVITRHPGRRPGASLPGPAPPGSAAGGRSPGSPAPGPPDLGMVRAAVACAVTAMAGSGRRSRYRRPAARDRPRPGRDLAGMARPGLGPSGSVSSLTVPLPVRACPAPGSLGCRGARDLTGRPARPRSCRHGRAGVARWAASVPRCGQPLVPTGPQRPVRIFSNHTVLPGAPLRNRTVDLLLTI